MDLYTDTGKRVLQLIQTRISEFILKFREPFLIQNMNENNRCTPGIRYLVYLIHFQPCYTSLAYFYTKIVTLVVGSYA